MSFDFYKEINPYIKVLENKYEGFYFNEKKASLFKGKWREVLIKQSLNDERKGFHASAFNQMDLEIGIGKGGHMIFRAENFRNRTIMGVDLRYKRLVQALRRASGLGLKNLKVFRFDVRNIKNFFSQNELNDIFIHFPDPWKKRRHKKNRFLTQNFIRDLYFLQKKDGEIEIKTDCRDYFEEILTHFQKSSYKIHFKTYDFHHFVKNQDLSAGFFYSKKYLSSLYETPFEKIFIKQGQPIYFLRAIKC